MSGETRDTGCGTGSLLLMGQSTSTGRPGRTQAVWRRKRDPNFRRQCDHVGEDPGDSSRWRDRPVERSGSRRAEGGTGAGHCAQGHARASYIFMCVLFYL